MGRANAGLVERQSWLDTDRSATLPCVFAALQSILRQDERIRHALVFGSHARGNPRPNSDLDLAIGTRGPLAVMELGDLIGRLEAASGRSIDLVLLEEARPALAYRVFRDGMTIFSRDDSALAQRRARAILEYLDFKPIEDICTRGVLAAARRGR